MGASYSIITTYYDDIVYNSISNYFNLFKIETHQSWCTFGHHFMFYWFRWSSFENGNKLNIYYENFPNETKQKMNSAENQKQNNSNDKVIITPDKMKLWTLKY